MFNETFKNSIQWEQTTKLISVSELWRGNFPRLNLFEDEVHSCCTSSGPSYSAHHYYLKKKQSLFSTVSVLFSLGKKIASTSELGSYEDRTLVHRTQGEVKSVLLSLTWNHLSHRSVSLVFYSHRSAKLKWYVCASLRGSHSYDRQDV